MIKNPTSKYFFKIFILEVFKLNTIAAESACIMQKNKTK